MAIVLLFCAYFLVNFFKQSSNIVVPMFARMFGFSNSVQGLLTAVYFIPYALMQLLAGTLCRKLTSLRVAGYSLLVASLGALCFAFAGAAVDMGTFLIVSGRFLTGFGTGCIFITLIHYESTHYSGKKFAIIVGLGFVCSGFGTICSVVPLEFLLDNLGIKAGFLIIAAVVAFMGMLLVLHKKEDAVVETGSVFSELKSASREIMSREILIWGMVIWAAYVGIQNSYSGMWCTTWAQLSFPDKTSRAGIFGTIYAVSIMAGSLSAEVCHRKSVTYTTTNIRISCLFAVSFICAVLFHGYSDAWGAAVSIAVLGFATGVIAVLLMALCKEKATLENCSTISGIWNCLAAVAVVFTQWCSGILIDIFNYNISLAVFAVIYAVCTIGFAVRCREKH